MSSVLNKSEIIECIKLKLKENWSEFNNEFSFNEWLNAQYNQLTSLNVVDQFSILEIECGDILLYISFYYELDNVESLNLIKEAIIDYLKSLALNDLMNL